MDSITGTCRFCGSVILADCSPENADEYASRHCCCDESLKYGAMRKRVDRAVSNAVEIFGENCEQYGFPKPVHPQGVQMIIAIIEAVSREEMQGAKLDFGELGKADISISAKGIIKVARSHGHKITTEA